MKLLSDNPASDDTLGLGNTADLLSQVVLTADPPFTLGLFGEWGSGKTTLMRMVEGRIRASNRKTVWFNAWKYDGKEIIWNALIQAIFYSMRDDPEVKGEKDKEAFRSKVGHAAISLAKYAAKVGTRFIPGGIVKEEDVDKIVDTLSASNATSDDFEFINKFESHFDDLVREFTGGKGALTIFIDDLDRCLPDNAIAILEAVKLYLDRASCVFVIGAEVGIIQEGITLRYGANSKLSARDYIEKIVQLPFMMRGIQSRNALSLLAINNDMNEFVENDLAKLMIAEATSNNPRRLKRYVNTLLVLEALTGALDLQQRLILSKILLIQMRFPDLYYELLRDEDVAYRLSKILSLKPLEQEAQVAQGSEVLRRLYQDQILGRFLVKTQEIPCTASDIRPWVELTHGNAIQSRPLKIDPQIPITLPER
jgi:energy-coupling factor transporter ATP-binding protein EcfA2